MHCQILDLLKSTAKFRNAWYMQILQCKLMFRSILNIFLVNILQVSKAIA